MRWPPDSWPWPRSLLLFVGTLVIFVVTATVLVIAGAALHLFSLPQDDPKNMSFLLGAQIVTYVPLIALLLFALPRVARLPLSQIGFRAPTPRDLGIGAAGAVVMFAVVVGIGQALASAGIKAPEQSVEIFKHLRSAGDRTLFISVACVFAPISEELFFRAFLFSAFRRYAPTLGAAALSGAVFGFSHIAPASHADLVPQVLAVGVPLACGGIVLAYVFMTSGCYWSSVLTHACFNGASVIGILVFHQ